MNKSRKLQLGAWGLSLITCAVAFIAWGQGNRWHFDDLSSYNLFPLFGLLAFSLMWSHYIIAAVRQYTGIEKKYIQSYFSATAWAVLAFILLHPGLLIWQLWRDGFGLPPGSYLRNYVAPNAAWAALLGSVSLFIFLAYELHRKFKQKPWWKYVQYLSDIAMFFIFFHALRLGRQLRPDWFRMVWWVYGVSLAAALLYNYAGRNIGIKKEEV